MSSINSAVHAPISAKEIGNFFIQQYYDILQKDPQYACRFYNEGSHLVVVDRLDTGSTETATTLKLINDILMSLEFDKVVIENIQSVDSWKEGILVVLSGYMDTSVDFEGAPVVVRKKFTQTIFLAPQNKGYFVESDIVHYFDAATVEDGSEQLSEDAQEPDKALEAEASEHLNSVDVVENAHTDHSGHKHDNEPETVKEEAPLEVSSATQQMDNDSAAQKPVAAVEQIDKHTAQIPVAAVEQIDKHSAQIPVAAVEEPVAEPPKFSYASIVQKGMAKGEASIQPSYVKMAPPQAVQQPRPASVASRPVSVASRPGSVASDRADGSSGESVYVKNLPPGISKHDVLEEFKQFGRIKQDGVFVKTSPDSGFCFGFVDFMDIEGAQNAVKASPLSLDGRPVYIEFKKAGTSPSGPPPRGGRGGGGGRGQGRGGRGNTDGRY